MASSWSRATPRSITLTTWSSVMSTFSGLRSRWIDPRVVDGDEALGDLPPDVTAELLGDPLQLVQEATEGLPLDVLHDEEVLLVPIHEQGVAVEAPDDVVLLDRLPDLRLAQEALEEARRLQEVGMDDLQGDAAAVVQTGGLALDLGEVDLPHAARAKFGDDRRRGRVESRSRVRPPLLLPCSAHASMISRFSRTFSSIDSRYSSGACSTRWSRRRLASARWLESRVAFQRRWHVCMFSSNPRRAPNSPYSACARAASPPGMLARRQAETVAGPGRGSSRPSVRVSSSSGSASPCCSSSTRRPASDSRAYVVRTGSAVSRNPTSASSTNCRPSVLCPSAAMTTPRPQRAACSGGRSPASRAMWRAAS